MENIANDLKQISAIARTLQPLRDLKAVLPANDSLSAGVDGHVHRREYEYLVDMIDIQMHYSYWFGRFLTAYNQVMQKHNERPGSMMPRTLIDTMSRGDHRELVYALLVAYKRFNASTSMPVLMTAIDLVLPHLNVLDTIPHIGLELSVRNHLEPIWHIRTWQGVDIPTISYSETAIMLKYANGNYHYYESMTAAVFTLVEYLNTQNTLLPLE